MRVAVIGAGISGLTAAYYLHKQGHDVIVYEKNDYVGGHTDTHLINDGDSTLSVDSGFIVFNEKNYPGFTALLNELGVESQASDMSFSVNNLSTGLEYNSTNLNGIFCQRRNLLRPSFYRMIRDIFRFYKNSPELLQDNGDDIPIHQYLSEHKYSQTFINDHIYPMACALWSSSSSMIESFPARYLVAFMNNHCMLQVRGRPQWRVIKGGSSRYVEALIKPFADKIRKGTHIYEISRCRDTVNIISEEAGSENFDKVFMACHSDQALELLVDATPKEFEVLSRIPYQKNEMVLHCDSNIMPKNPKAWASWNAHVTNDSYERCTVTYYMNLLQSLNTKTPYLVTLNPSFDIDERKVFQRRTYYHPVYTTETIAAQNQRDQINGFNNTYFCGAYWGWGFHEDGVQSALHSVEKFSFLAGSKTREVFHAA